jgi:hypothetical protein
MPPRIRSLVARPPYVREAKAPVRRAPAVFREFVETLQRLDPPPAPNARRRYGRRKNGLNGHAWAGGRRRRTRN